MATAWRPNRILIDRRRILAGMTVTRLALEAHISDRTLRDLLAGRRQPSIATVMCVLRALGIDAADGIVFGDEEAA